MRIALSQIGPGTKTISLRWPPKRFGRLDSGEPGLGLEVVGPVEGEARINGQGDKIRLDGRVTCRVEYVCHRCLKEVREPVAVEFDLIIMPQDRSSQFDVGAACGGDEAITSEELDVVVVEGEELDLSEVVREQILLSRPLVNLCRPDCRGFVPNAALI